MSVNEKTTITIIVEKRLELDGTDTFSQILIDRTFPFQSIAQSIAILVTSIKDALNKNFNFLENKDERIDRTFPR